MKEKGNVNEEIKNSCDPARIRENKRNTTLWAKANYQLPSCTGWGTCNWWASGVLRGYLFTWLSTRTYSCNFSDPKAFLETGGLLCTARHYAPFLIKTGAETTQLRNQSTGNDLPWVCHLAPSQHAATNVLSWLNGVRLFPQREMESNINTTFCTHYK